MGGLGWVTGLASDCHKLTEVVRVECIVIKIVCSKVWSKGITLKEGGKEERREGEREGGRKGGREGGKIAKINRV